MNLARNFTILRKKSGLSQEQMAEKCGVSRSALAKWETGNTAPAINYIIKAAEVFNVTLDELVFGKTELVKDDTKKIYAAIEKMISEQKMDNNDTDELYEKYLKELKEMDNSDREDMADIYYFEGVECAEKGNYTKAVPLLEQALKYGSISAMGTLINIHKEILDIIADTSESNYWSYKLEIAQKIQTYGKIVENEIRSGNVF